MLKRILFLFAVAFMASPFLFAQVTTSAINGNVKSATNEALVGASIVATHLPSGTKYATTTRAGGQFSIVNMKPGGPYLIEITFVGFTKEKYEDVYLTLGESYAVEPLLNKTNATLENVLLTTGGRSKILNSNRTGAVTNIGLRQITNSPSISRSINDLTRATPQSNNNAFGGGNYRQSNFTVDGAEFNNSFGIGTGNLPAGGSPISLDALDEISVNLTPFDVRQSGFIGGAINAVTRSGTNTFSGSVYSYFRTERQRGRKVDKTFFVRAPESFKQKGFRIGGPIIKNKLFFFLNYETDNTPRVIQTRVASTASAAFGTSDNIARPSADSLNYISQYLLSNYGYETGAYQNYTPNVERKKFLARIDWNINSKNRMNIRYSQVVGGTPLSMSSSLNSGGTVGGNGATRLANTALWYENSNYFQGENFYSFAAELNSTIGRLSNVIRGTYTFQDENRSTPGAVFPFVDILSTTAVTPQSGSGLGAPYTSFGYEPFSFGNLRSVKVYSIVDNLSWTTKKHKWNAGVQYETSRTINGFQPFGASYYRFATWGDFASALDPNPLLRKLPTDFVQTFSLSKDFAPAFSSYKFTQYSAYAQDEIAINKNFRLTVGIRFELPTYPDVPQIVSNPLLAALSFEKGEKLNSGILPKNRIMWSPRIGFNWDFYGDRSLQIRGGVGVFTGKIPAVWVVSQSGTNNMIQVTQAFNTYTSTGTLSGVLPPGPFNPNPIAYRPANVPASGTSVNSTPTIIAPNFKNPQSLKSSLAIDTKLPGGIIATLEALYNKDLQTIFPRNPNLNTPQPLGVAGYPDNRMIYGGTVQTRFINTLNGTTFVPQVGGTGTFNPTVLDNAKKGHYFSITAKFEKTFSKGLFASVAYTKSVANNLHDGGGDQPSGVWSGTPTVNGANVSPLGYADYVVPDRVIGVFSYRKEYFKHLATTISLIYNGSIAGRFSYVYGGDVNRDGVNNNDLIYIPKDATNTSEISFGTANITVNGVTYTPAQQGILFEEYIQQDRYLSKHRGQYAERNGAQIPWRNQMDVKFMQDLFVSAGKSKNTFQFTMDIFNFGNFINSGWGKQKTINTSQILTATLPTGFNPGGSVVPTFRLPTVNNQIITRTFRDNISIFSTYSVQFGLRYIFN
ncbi:MAG: TonB-dependent receptor [Chitinophagaceae bacterium]|nr:TonB-dependent receptor [Chitinophagaceae bacterium]